MNGINGMNGMTARSMNSYDGGRPQYLGSAQAPKGPALVDAYRQDARNMREKPRYNPLNPERVQSSVLVDLKDPVQVHLLTETALYDSKEYEILSQEEVDDLKRQVQSMTQRIEQTRASLAIQSKYRDAAIAMSKLYTPTNGKRRSLMPNRNSGGEAAEAEREQIQKKCEALAFELWSLEKRAMEPRRRLLEHTAGILQLTHKTVQKGRQQAPRGLQLINGVPASPESMYTSSNGRDSTEPPDDVLFFDDGGLHQYFEESGGFGSGRPRKNTLEIPLKSPVREQQKQLAEESEKLREENARLKRQAESLQMELENIKTEGKDQFGLISETERKLEVFNDQLREVIVRSNPAKNGGFKRPPSGRLEPGDMIGSHLSYLEKGLINLGEDQAKNTEAAERLQSINMAIQDLLLDTVTDHPPPPEVDAELEEQMNYLQFSVRAIEGELDRANALNAKATEMSSARSENKKKEEQAETVLLGLWEIIQSGYADIRERKLERRKTRTEKGLTAEDEDASDNEGFDPNEKYTLSAFSTKVQWLYAQATSLKEQKDVLKRQVKQQRELNNKTDGEKDEALKAKSDELEKIRLLLDRTEKEVDDVRKQLSLSLANLEDAQSTAQRSGTEQSAAIREVQDQLKERNAKIAALEASSKTQLEALEANQQSQRQALEASSKSQLDERNAKIASLEASTQDTKARLSAAEASILVFTQQLTEANNAKDAANKAVEEKTKEIKAKEEELDQVTGMMAEFKMEATLAKAELDGAYGSRKERAKEAAAFANTSETSKLQTLVAELQPRVQELESELRGTIKDLKDITKQAIDAESKIADLESELDRAGQTARKEREALQEALDNERLKVPTASGATSPGGRGNTSILTDSYRDALRAERRKYEDQLRTEQMGRRKLEDELKALKKGLGPGKSPLSPR